MKAWCTEILKIKAKILIVYKRTSTTSAIYDFENSIQGCHSDLLMLNRRLRHVTKREQQYLQKYFYAVLMSAYMEKEGYTLTNWQLFVSRIHPYLKKRYSVLSFNIIDNRAGIGDAFEILILHYINSVIKSNNLVAARVNSKEDPSELLNEFNENIFGVEHEFGINIIEGLKTKMKIRGVREAQQVWGDNDIVVLSSPGRKFIFNNAEAFCIISCKTSLRERAYQSAFWAMHSRLEGIIKHVFITLDKGSENSSEIGHRDKADQKAKKTRNALESIMDRVYVFREAAEVSRSFTIKDFNKIDADLYAWRRDYFSSN